MAALGVTSNDLNRNSFQNQFRSNFGKSFKQDNMHEGRTESMPYIKKQDSFHGCPKIQNVNPASSQAQFKQQYD